jgi:cytochrome P450
MPMNTSLLINTIGATYKRHASITVPLFRRARVISNLPLIIDCTDKLLARWRADMIPRVHVDISEQCHELLLAVFGLIAFDYDLETLDGEIGAGQNELTLALHDFLSTFQMTLQLPNLLPLFI